MGQKTERLNTCAKIRKHVTGVNKLYSPMIINKMVNDDGFGSIEELNEDDTRLMCELHNVKYIKKKTKLEIKKEKEEAIFADGPIYIQSYVLDELKRDAEAYIRRGLKRKYNMLFPDIDIFISIYGFENNHDKYIVEGYLMED